MKQDFQLDFLVNKNLNQQQKQAVVDYFNEDVSVINGQAGTGKTTTVKEIIVQDIIKNWNENLKDPNNKTITLYGVTNKKILEEIPKAVYDGLKDYLKNNPEIKNQLVSNIKEIQDYFENNTTSYVLRNTIETLISGFNEKATTTSLYAFKWVNEKPANRYSKIKNNAIDYTNKQKYNFETKIFLPKYEMYLQDFILQKNPKDIATIEEQLIDNLAVSLIEKYFKIIDLKNWKKDLYNFVALYDSNQNTILDTENNDVAIISNEFLTQNLNNPTFETKNKMDKIGSYSSSLDVIKDNNTIKNILDKKDNTKINFVCDESGLISMFEGEDLLSHIQADKLCLIGDTNQILPSVKSVYTDFVSQSSIQTSLLQIANQNPEIKKNTLQQLHRSNKLGLLFSRNYTENDFFFNNTLEDIKKDTLTIYDNKDSYLDENQDILSEPIIYSIKHFNDVFKANKENKTFEELIFVGNQRQKTQIIFAVRILFDLFNVAKIQTNKDQQVDKWTFDEFFDYYVSELKKYGFVENKEELIKIIENNKLQKQIQNIYKTIYEHQKIIKVVHSFIEIPYKQEIKKLSNNTETKKIKTIVDDYTCLEHLQINTDPNIVEKVKVLKLPTIAFELNNNHFNDIYNKQEKMSYPKKENGEVDIEKLNDIVKNFIENNKEKILSSSSELKDFFLFSVSDIPKPITDVKTFGKQNLKLNMFFNHSEPKTTSSLYHILDVSKIDEIEQSFLDFFKDDDDWNTQKENFLYKIEKSLINIAYNDFGDIFRTFIENNNYLKDESFVYQLSDSILPNHYTRNFTHNIIELIDKQKLYHEKEGYGMKTTIDDIRKWINDRERKYGYYDVNKSNEFKLDLEKNLFINEVAHKNRLILQNVHTPINEVLNKLSNSNANEKIKKHIITNNEKNNFQGNEYDQITILYGVANNKNEPNKTISTFNGFNNRNKNNTILTRAKEKINFIQSFNLDNIKDKTEFKEHIKWIEYVKNQIDNPQTHSTDNKELEKQFNNFKQDYIVKYNFELVNNKPVDVILTNKKTNKTDNTNHILFIENTDKNQDKINFYQQQNITVYPYNDLENLKEILNTFKQTTTKNKNINIKDMF